MVLFISSFLSKTKRMNIERPTPNIVFCQFKNTEQHGAQAPALRERISHSKFCGQVFCGLHILKLDKA
jgi:hypothetical protein